MTNHMDLIQRNFMKVEQSILSLVNEKENLLPIEEIEEKMEYAEKDYLKYDRLIMRFERAIEIACNIFFRAVEMAEYGTLSPDTGACITKMKHLSLIASEELWLKMINGSSEKSSAVMTAARIELCNQILTQYIDELHQFCNRVKQKFGLT